METGFEGCIQYIRFDEKFLNISFPSNDIINGGDIGKFSGSNLTILKFIKQKAILDYVF